MNFQTFDENKYIDIIFATRDCNFYVINIVTRYKLTVQTETIQIHWTSSDA